MGADCSSQISVSPGIERYRGVIIRVICIIFDYCLSFIASACDVETKAICSLLEVNG